MSHKHAASYLLSLAACLLLLPATAAASNAGEINGVAFEQSVRIGEAPVPLRGVGLLRYRIFFDAYVAAFYADHPDWQTRPLDNDSRRLEIEYFWGLKADQFANATIEGIRANVSDAKLAELRPRIERFNALYEDIEPGDRYALTYGSGKTELAKNGRPLGAVEGEDFARAIFGIWLGESPLSPELKSQLLGRNAR